VNPVARAKQTARAEARRRHRLANRLEDEAQPNELDGADLDDAPARPPTATSRSASSARAQTPARATGPIRIGIGAAFRGAYHPAHVREDLTFLPSLLVSRAFLGAIGLMLVGAAAFATFPGYTGATFLFQTLTYPPAMAPIFVVGFFAPRASYLLGFLVGVIDALLFAVLVTAVAPAIGIPTDPTLVPSLIGTALFTGAVTGTFFAAAAAWYRRFLSLSSPRRVAAPKGGGNRSRATAKGSARR
jgi:hypothetical protein